jgi:two-component system sensor histidine kinase RegB
MAPADLARAGEPFFTTKPPGRGTGLGLFVARSSVEELGGRLVVDSRQGRGTTVTIELPVDVLGTAHA